MTAHYVTHFAGELRLSQGRRTVVPAGEVACSSAMWRRGSATVTTERGRVDCARCLRILANEVKR